MIFFFKSFFKPKFRVPSMQERIEHLERLHIRDLQMLMRYDALAASSWAFCKSVEVIDGLAPDMKLKAAHLRLELGILLEKEW